MGAVYLVRFDDVCPTMNWAVWDQVEKVLLDKGIKPILAVVPDNRDPKLDICKARADFWDRVRHWKEIGWTIALHGYRHAYVTDDAGIVGLNTRSEFAGLPEEEQEEKLRSGLGIFEEQGIETDVWIAPAHSFDRTTVRLLTHLGVSRLSDGMFPWPHVDRDGMLWVPQQFWQFRPMSFGVWTVCCHINSWSQAEIDAFTEDISTYSGKIGDFDEVSELYARRRANLFDYASSRAYLKAMRVRERLGRAKRRLIQR